MNIFWAIMMGTVQGLTEFFPVSSSAHLAIIPWLFKFTDPGLTFDIALHAGTFFAILVALWSDWQKMLTSLFARQKSFEKKLILFLIITSIPGAIVGALLESKAETIFRAPVLIAFVLVVFGVILYLVDRYFPQKSEVKDMDTRSAFLIGLSQAIAIIPGVSRSGATITAGRALGFSREAAVKYSFLAALPIIFGAAAFGLRHATASEFSSATWILGFLAAFASSFAAIKIFLSLARKQNFDFFVFYRIGLAVLIIIILLGR